MGQYTSYWLYQRYEQRGEQEPIPYYPNTYSIDGDGTMPLVVRREDDEQCGYIPPYEPIYRWIPTMDTVCINDGKKLKATYGDGSFYELVCNESTRLTRGETNPSGYQASAMTTAEIGDCVISIGIDAFSGCTSLTSVRIPDSVNWLADGAFQYCESLPNLLLPTGVTHIGEAAFWNCTSLTNIGIPNNVTYIGPIAFSNCTSLTDITIPTGLTFWDQRTFEYCTSLTSVTLPNDVSFIPYSSFQYCTSLENIDIPDNITNIGDGAFENCTSLTSVTIPSGVTYIGGAAFSNCANLTSVTCLATTPPTLGYYSGYLWRTFYNTNNCPIYVPCESVEAYKRAWVNIYEDYSDRIIGISPCL